MPNQPSQSLADLWAPVTPHAGGPNNFVGAAPGTGGRPLKHLPTRARVILSMEMQGHDRKAIAERIGMSAVRVNQICRSDRYIEAREAFLGKLDADFNALGPVAVSALSNGLRSRDENTALRASEQWMKAAGFMQYGKGGGQQGVTAEDVARQLLQVNVNVDMRSTSPIGDRSNTSLIGVEIDCTTMQRMAQPECQDGAGVRTANSPRDIQGGGEGD